MTTTWIVHRDARIRDALARVAAAPDDAPTGAPGDPLFDSAPFPQVVVLGLAGDLEAELEFAHRISSRLPDSRWILIPEPSDAAMARKLFDSIDATILPYPPDPRALREQIQSAAAVSQSHHGLGASRRLPLSGRPGRDAIAQQFARWFADLELPELLRALDPQLGDVPLLISGEEGTGRGLLAAYVHLFGSAPTGPLIHIPCHPALSAGPLQAALADAAAGTSGGERCTIWLEGVDTLSAGTQQQLARWIEFSPPPGLLRGRIARWIASTAGNTTARVGGGLDPVLRDRLCGISLALPSVRERAHFIEPFANDTALSWCHSHREHPRRLAKSALTALREYPWPGNLRELETVVLQTLAASGADPIEADDLQYDGTAFAPLDASAIGTMLDFEPFPKPSTEPAAKPETVSAAREATAVIETLGAPTDQHDTPATQATVSAAAQHSWVQHFVTAIAHELRNPLSTIRTFAELLPDRFDDPEFRSQFAELVSHDTRQIEGVVQRLMDLASFSPLQANAVNIAKLLEELLEQRTDRVRGRELLVLRELDTRAPDICGDAGQLRFALESLLDKSLELAPKGGDIYIASSYQPAGVGGGAMVRVLVRFGNRGGNEAPRRPIPGTSTAENALEYAIAEAIIRTLGGDFSLSISASGETVLLLDIPA